MEDTEGFLMLPAQAEEFFNRVSKLKDDNLQNRLKLLEDMVKERLIFKQNKEQIKKRLNGKKVIRVKHEPKN